MSGYDPFAQLTKIAVSTPVNPAQVLKQLPANTNIGVLDTRQVTGMLSSIAAGVNQRSNVFSVDKGVGKYGLSPSQLEQQGYIKPGTVMQFGNDTAKLSQALSLASTWTGKKGANSLTNFLGNETLQTATQQNIMQQSFKQLQASGVVSAATSALQVASLVQASSKLGVSAVTAWTKGQAPAQVVGQITNIAKNAQQAVSLVATKIPFFGGFGSKNTGGATNTFNRSQVDGVVQKLIGNNKIPIPKFGADAISNKTTST